jgi:hypothetical protein
MAKTTLSAAKQALTIGNDDNDKKIVEVLEKTVTTEVMKRIGVPLQAVVHDAVVEAIAAASHTGEVPAQAEPKQVQSADVHRPKAGGRCAAVWDELDRIRTGNGVPMLSDIMKVGRHLKWNDNNTRVEYYAWRKFHGISGRIGRRTTSPRRFVINAPSYRGPDRRAIGSAA